MRMEDDVDAQDGVDLDCDVDMERDGDDDKVEEEEEEDEEKEDEEEVKEEDEEEEEEDKDEDDGKKPRTIGQGEMVNTSADDADTMVDDEPTVLPEQGQEMRAHTPRPQPPAPTPRPRTMEPPSWPRTPETHTLSGLDCWGLWRHTNLPQQRQHCEKLRQLGTPRMSMLSSSYSANRQVATVSLMSLSRMSFSRMSLSPMSYSRMSLTRISRSWMSLSRMSLSWVSLSPMSLSSMSSSLISLSLKSTGMARWAKSEPVLGLQRRRAFGFESGYCLVSFLCCNQFISGTDWCTRGGVVVVWVRVVGLFVSCVLIYLCQALIITCVARFLDCSGCIFHLFIVLWDIAHAVFLQLLAWWCWGSINLSSIVGLYTHQTAQALLQLSSLSTVITPLLSCCGQCQRRPHSVALNFHAERSSPQTAGDLNISNWTILNTFKLQRIWLFAGCHNTLNPLRVVNSTLTKNQSKTWMRFPTSNTFNTSQTRNLNHHHHLLCHRRKHTPAPVLYCGITLPNHGNATRWVALRRTYRTIATTRLRPVKSTNICSVGSRSRVWRRTMTMCWRKKTPHGVSQVSKMGMASRSSWLACQVIRLSRSGNHTLSRIWDGMTITNGLSNTGVETSSKAWNGWCGSQPMPGISFTPLSITLTAICHRHASILKCTLWTGGGRHR